MRISENIPYVKHWLGPKGKIDEQDEVFISKKESCWWISLLPPLIWLKESSGSVASHFIRIKSERLTLVSKPWLGPCLCLWPCFTFLFLWFTKYQTHWPFFCSYMFQSCPCLRVFALTISSTYKCLLPSPCGCLPLHCLSGWNVTSFKRLTLTTLSSTLCPILSWFIFFIALSCSESNFKVRATFWGLPSHDKNVSRLCVLGAPKSLYLEQCLVHSRCS